MQVSQSSLVELVEVVCEEYQRALNPRLSDHASKITILNPLVISLVHSTMPPPPQIHQRVAQFSADVIENGDEDLKSKLLAFMEGLEHDPTTLPINPTPLSSVFEVAAKSGRILVEGKLKKKGRLWHDRYFMIREVNPDTKLCVLSYFRKEGDPEPRDWFVLGPHCDVDEVRESPSKIENKHLFTFRLTIRMVEEESSDAAFRRSHSADLTAESPDALTLLQASPHSTKNQFSDVFDVETSKKKKAKKRIRYAAATAAATAVVLTGGLAGVTMAASVGFGAAGVGALFGQSKSNSMGVVVVPLAATSRENAEEWRTLLMKYIAEAKEQWDAIIAKEQDHVPLLDGLGKTKRVVRRTTSLPAVNSSRFASRGNMPATFKNVAWTSAEGESKWSIYKHSEFGGTVWVEDASHSVPSLKTSTTIQTTPEKAFEMLMDVDGSFYQPHLNPVISRARLLCTLDAHSDMLHLQLSRFPILAGLCCPRDLCVLRYWRKEENGSYVICFQSTIHPECPETDGYIRANWIGGGFIIAPRLEGLNDIVQGQECGIAECLITMIIQLDPRGWLGMPIGKHIGLSHDFGEMFLSQLAVAKYSIEHAMYVTTKKLPLIGVQPICEQSSVRHQGILSWSTEAKQHRVFQLFGGSLSQQYWDEPPASSFSVRSRDYFSNQRENRGDTSFLCLVGIDWEERSSTTAFQIMRRRNLHRSSDDPFIWVINFIFPRLTIGRVRCMILYFTPSNVDKLKQDDAFSALYYKFIDGDSDSFRDQRLRILPSVLQGPWILQAGVGSTPICLGSVLKQTYDRGPNYFEMDCDVSTSSVASGIVRFLMAHSEELVIDLAWVLEAQSPAELPEQVLATARLQRIPANHTPRSTSPQRQAGD